VRGLRGSVHTQPSHPHLHPTPTARSWKQILQVVNRHGEELEDAQAVAALNRLAQLLEREPVRSSWEVSQAQALYNWLTNRVQEARAREAQSARMAAQKALIQQQQQRQQQQRDLQQQPQQQQQPAAASRQLSPEQQVDLADDRLRAALAAGSVPQRTMRLEAAAGGQIDGFLVREVRRAAQAGGGGGGGQQLVRCVQRYAALMELKHVALAAEQLVQLYARGGSTARAGGADLEAAAAALFGAATPMVQRSSASGVAAMIGAMADMGLYDEQLLSDILGRALQLLPSFTASQLSWTLHGLAELQLRPPARWLATAVERARQLLPTATLEDLERTASALALMRHPPGPAFVQAAEVRTEQLAADVDAEDEDEEASLLGAIKALALLGGPSSRAYRWYTGAVRQRESKEAAAERERALEQQQRQERAAAAEAAQKAEAQAAAQAAQAEAERRQLQVEHAAERERARREALIKQQQERQRLKQQQQAQQQQQQQARHPRHHLYRHDHSASGQAAPGLVSIDDLFTSALDQPPGDASTQQPTAKKRQQQRGQKGSGQSHLLDRLDEVEGLQLREVGGQQTGQQQQQQQQVQAADAPLWAAEQRSRWKQGRPPAGGDEDESDAAPAAAAAAAATRAPLGSSGMAPFAAAAKALRSGGPPNRNMLVGCLEAVDQERRELQRQLVQMQMQREFGGGSSSAGGESDDGSDPYAKPVRQLLEDLARARWVDGGGSWVAAGWVGALMLAVCLQSCRVSHSIYHPHINHHKPHPKSYAYAGSAQTTTRRASRPQLLWRW